MFKNLNTEKYNHLTEPMFFGKNVGVARYDVVKYPFMEKLTNKQLSLFWRPEEINCSNDAKDFKALTDVEKNITILNIKRQIILDSCQGRAPALILAPICSLPELENFIMTWTFFETIHSRSYTHIIKTVYPNPSEIFDSILNDEEIKKCAVDISKYYDSLHEYNVFAQWNEGFHGDREHKKRLWLCLNAVNALEGIRFYVSFACTWGIAERKRAMQGNARIIQKIADDEAIHLGFTQQLLKRLPQDDPEFISIREETKDEVLAMFKSVVDQEVEWANYLFKDGQIIGLNAELLKQYVYFLAQKRCLAIGLEQNYWKGISDPLPWIQKNWIGSSDVQDAPQEVNKVEYTIGELNNNVENTSDLGGIDF